MPRATKTHEEQVVSKVGKRPQTAKQIAQKMGYGDRHQAVSKALGSATQKGLIVRTEKGYQRAL